MVILAFFKNFTLQSQIRNKRLKMFKSYCKKVAQIPFMHPYSREPLSFPFLKKINIAMPSCTSKIIINVVCAVFIRPSDWDTSHFISCVLLKGR